MSLLAFRKLYRAYSKTAKPTFKLTNNRCRQEVCIANMSRSRMTIAPAYRCGWCKLYYAALLPRRGPHIASHSVCLSVCPSVPLLFTLEPSYERTSKIEKLLFSLMGQRHVCTFRHALRAAYRTAIVSEMTYTVSSGTLNSSIPYHRTAISAAQILVYI